MKIKKTSIIVLSTLLILLFLASVTYASAYYGNLNFTAEDVYYEGTTLVVYGYWLNNSNKYIPYTNWVSMDVSRWNGRSWEIISSGTFTRDYLKLEPGETKYWTYRITNSPIKSLNRWLVQTQVNFQWRDSDNNI